MKRKRGRIALLMAETCSERDERGREGLAAGILLASTLGIVLGVELTLPAPSLPTRAPGGSARPYLRRGPGWERDVRLRGALQGPVEPSGAGKGAFCARHHDRLCRPRNPSRPDRTTSARVAPVRMLRRRVLSRNIANVTEAPGGPSAAEDVNPYREMVNGGCCGGNGAAAPKVLDGLPSPWHSQGAEGRVRHAPGDAVRSRKGGQLWRTETQPRRQFAFR
jgi:hypothetical protein